MGALAEPSELAFGLTEMTDAAVRLQLGRCMLQFRDRPLAIAHLGIRASGDHPRQGGLDGCSDGVCCRRRNNRLFGRPVAFAPLKADRCRRSRGPGGGHRQPDRLSPSLGLLGGTRCIVGRYVSVHPDCDVGDGSRVYDHAHLASGTTMGVDCYISLHVAMASDNALGALPYAPDRVRGPDFGDRVSVGVGATILPGIRLGDDSTVAAGAVVTREVEAKSFVRGVTARASDRDSE